MLVVRESEDMEMEEDGVWVLCEGGGVLLLSHRHGTSTDNTSISKITCADASKAKDAQLQRFCALAV